jgi:poly(3-hydroxybutyrate) depolymerase
VHIALHGCRQSARTFATRAGYNNWAEHYKTIVVYPAIEPSTPVSEAVCQAEPVNPFLDSWYFEPNLNGCWDWWGYLDTSSRKDRYLTKDGPQIRVIERIIAEVTARP